jgi:hypothetical protein
MNARHEDVPLADIPRYTWLLSRYPNFLASFIRPFREVAVRRFCLAIEQRLALMAALLGMVAPPGQPKSTPAVRAMATIAASRLKVLSVYFAIWVRTVEAPRTLCTEATVSVAPGSLFRVRRS